MHSDHLLSSSCQHVYFSFIVEYKMCAANAETVCQVAVCPATCSPPCDLGYEAMAVTTAHGLNEDDEEASCCPPAVVCVPREAAALTQGGGRPCPPLVEPRCSRHQVARLIGPADSTACPKLVCGMCMYEYRYLCISYLFLIGYKVPVSLDLFFLKLFLKLK